MTFGRMNNLRRRAHRPDENFHRERRRRAVARSYRSGRPSALGQLLRGIMAMIIRK